MAVTRSTAADWRRQGFPVLGARAAGAGLPGLPVRRRETVLLAAAALVALLGLLLVFLATSQPLAAVDKQIAAGEIVNLNGLRSSTQLLPVLDVFESSAERSFVAEEIWKRSHQSPLQNVGELARMRVPGSEIERNKRLESFGARLEAAKRRAGSDAENLSVTLLTLQQLRDVKPRLVVRSPSQFRTSFWLWTAAFIAAFVAVHLVWRQRRFGGDELILPILLVLAGIGLAAMVSVRDPLRDLPLFRTFVQGVFGGCVLMAAGSLVDWERSPLRRRSFAPLFGAFLLSIALILFGSGPEGSDAKVNLLGFQPVEIIKILVVLFLAGYFFDRWEFLRELPETRAALPGLLRRLGIPKLEYLLPPILAIGLVLVFFFLQRDLGPALILSFLFLILYCVARGQPWMAAIGTTAIAAAFAVGYRLGIPRTVSGRLQMWLSPWDNGFRGGDHLAQGLWSLAGGAATGTGLGLGQPQRVPQVHTDLVLAAIGEELGFLGLLAVFALYVVLIQRGFRAAFRAGGIYSFFLALGLTVLVAVQILLIAGGVVGVVPLSGVVSPFLSSGRTAMLANFLILGMLAGISAHPGDRATTRRFHGAARWAAVGLGLVLAAIVFRAAQVQILQSNRFLTAGALTLQADGFRRFQYNPRLVDIAESIPRGNIVDRNGVLLATSNLADLVKRKAILERLGATLELPEREERGRRYYPFEGKTYHLLGDLNGRVNWAATNTSFAERDSRIRLQGYDDFAGVVEVEQPNGEVSREIQLDYTELAPVLRHRWQPDHPEVRRILDRDRTVRMSIDVRLQLKAAAILERQAQKAGFGAAAVVLDAKTGDLLVSASYPWPKQMPSEWPEEQMRHAERLAQTDNPGGLMDRARYGIYPPGSTFKVVTAMAALRKNPQLANTKYMCVRLADGRVGNRVRGWGRPIRDDAKDHDPHGVVTLEKGIVVSCNAYFAQLGTYSVGPEPILETAEALGISVANPSTAEQLKDALPQAAYGQGQVVATPFQMARVAATVADLGTMPEGRWVIDDSNTRRAEPVRIVESGLARFLAGAMRRVVTQGTAAGFLGGVVPAIAGKTGTAEVKDEASHSWFIGFAPYEARGGRRVAFGVIVEHGGYGGRFAAPAAGEIVREAAALGIIQP